MVRTPDSLKANDLTRLVEQIRMPCAASRFSDARARLVYASGGLVVV
ncbi:MAG: hypothetical protein ACK5RG_13960 [Cyclobacteriaceae bacterium]|jgi:hypothetical protein